jgi:hypothetical protein
VTSSEREGNKESVTERHTRGQDQTPKSPSILAGYWQKAIVKRKTNEAKKVAGLFTFEDGGSLAYSGYQRSVDDGSFWHRL